MWWRQLLWLLTLISSIYQAQSSCQEINDTIAANNRQTCRLPKITGFCKLKILRFYFDNSAATCNSFFYEGCGGNRNNFKTKEACECTCKNNIFIEFYGN